MATAAAEASSRRRDGAAPGAVSMPVLATVFALLALTTLMPILLTRILPFNDFPNHLARMHVIAVDGNDPVLDRFYGIEWKMIPNLAMDLIVPPLARLANVYLAGKLFVIAYMLLLLTGPHAIHYALYRRLSLGPLVAMLFLYNRINGSGNANYLFGVGLALWGIAVGIRFREAPIAYRISASLTFVLVLFFCHIGALGLYGFALAAFEMGLLLQRRPPLRRLLLDALVFLAPFAAVLPLLLLGPVSDTPMPPMQWDFLGKVYGPWSIIKGYQGGLDLAVGAIMAGIALWAARRGILRLHHPAAWPLIGGGVLAYLAMPSEIMGGWGVDLRFPLALFFVLIGFLEWRLPNYRAAGIFVLTLGALLVVRIAAVEAAWLRFAPIEADFERSLDAIPPGSTVLVAREQRELDPAWLMPIKYLACLAMIERSSLVSLAFAHPLQQVLVVKPPYRDAAGGYNDDPIPLADLLSPPERSLGAPSGRIYWADWRKRYDYLYVVSTRRGTNPDPGELTLVHDGIRFQLYRIRHAA